MSLRILNAKKKLAVLVLGAALIIASGCAYLDFLQGYRDAGGPVYYEGHLVNDVIPCESTWNPWAISPVGDAGLLQFAAVTWGWNARYPSAPWQSAYEQGWAGAKLLNWLNANGISPGSTFGWPHCWWTGGW